MTARALPVDAHWTQSAPRVSRGARVTSLGLV
jgi:hypothetical protein